MAWGNEANDYATHSGRTGFYACSEPVSSYIPPDTSKPIEPLPKPKLSPIEKIIEQSIINGTYQD